MQLMIVAGSQAEQSQSARTAHFLARRAVQLELCESQDVRVQDLGTDPLPLCNSSHRGVTSAHEAFLLACNALVLISPDWHGMATPAIKNGFYHLPPLVLEHKPVLLCGVSAGEGGVYPVRGRRTHSSKNFRPCYLPDQLIIRNVREQFLAADSARVERSLMRDRVDYCLRLLDAYASGFDGIRQQLPERDVAFSYGM